MVEDDSPESSSGIHWATVPAIYVNDIFFRIYANSQHHYVPELDDTWELIGNIKDATPGWESPNQNFQTNNIALMGAEIYYSSIGRVRITSNMWGIPIDEEVIGDSVIVNFDGSRLLFITEATHSEVIRVMETIFSKSYYNSLDMGD